MTALEQIEQASREYRLKHYGTLDVDMWGKKLLTSAEMLQVRSLRGNPHISLQSILGKAGFQ